MECDARPPKGWRVSCFYSFNIIFLTPFKNRETMRGMERTIAQAARDLGISKAALYLAIENDRVKTVARAGATVQKITNKEFVRFQAELNGTVRRGPKPNKNGNGKSKKAR